MQPESDTIKYRILLFASESVIHFCLKQKLEQEFLLSIASNSEQLEKISNEQTPQLVLIERNLATIDGADISELINNICGNKEIPTIFITDEALDDNADINDIICKSCKDEDFISQIKLTIHFHDKIREQNQIIDETRQMAFSAMSQSGEIGQILHFMRDSFECDTFEKLGNRILESMENQSLNTVVRFDTNPPIYFSHESEVARLDKEILDRLHMMERIVDFGIRSLYNFENISLLVKNMPLDDADKYGRIKDNVCLILEAADSKVKAINNEAALRIRDNSISKVIESSKEALKNIEAAFQENATKNAEIMLQLKEKIEWSFLQLGLSEDQEHEIAEIVQEAENKSTALYESGLQIEDQLVHLTSKLNEIISFRKS